MGITMCEPYLPDYTMSITMCEPYLSDSDPDIRMERWRGIHETAGTSHINTIIDQIKE